MPGGLPDLTVTGCRASKFREGSVVADVELNVTQPAVVMGKENQLYSEQLTGMFNTTAAQLVAPGLTVEVSTANVAGKFLLQLVASYLRLILQSVTTVITLNMLKYYEYIYIWN